MNGTCRTIRQRVAEQGVEAVSGDPRVDEHVTGCGGCRRALDALAELDAVLGTLPTHDAPDEVVDALLARVAADSVVDDSVAVARTRGRWSRFSVGFSRWIGTPMARRGLAMAALATMAVAVGLQLRVSHHDLGERQLQSRVSTGSTVSEEELERIPTGRDSRAVMKAVSGAEVDRISMGDEADGSGVETMDLVFGVPSSPQVLDADKLSALGSVSEVAEAKKQVPRRDAAKLDGEWSRLERPATPAPPAVAPVPEPPPPPAYVPSSITLEENRPKPVEGSPLGRTAPGKRERPRSSESEKRRDTFEALDDAEQELIKAKERVAESIAEEEMKDDDAQVAHRWNVDDVIVTDLGPVGSSPSYYAFEDGALDDGAVGNRAAGNRAARMFLAERRRTGGLTFQDPHGYWSNSYVPGDADLRWFAAHLAQQAPLVRATDAEDGPRLHDAAQPPTQPFDPPRNAAMALYLDSDRVGLTEPGRTLIQVGLRATDRLAGQRPALELAVVVDLEAGDAAPHAESIRALLDALVASVEPGDRVHVHFAGTSVEPVTPSRFRHGAVRVGLDDALAATRAASGEASDGTTKGLAETLASALDGLATGSRDLGAAAVLLVTAREDLYPFEDWAHESGLAGVPVTVVGLGGGVDREAMTDLALAGQGRVRHVTHPADAAAVITGELDAVSRVVARALRLRIRLAPGVSLIDVIGAEPLDLTSVARVREVEARIDQRLAAERGIAADRGDDEDGIQIVIPAFYAGDDHVVLLDVVAPGPGKVADVSLRYKDLVRTKNGIARARLKLGKREVPRRDAARQRTRGVVKNLLAHETSTALKAAAEVLLSDANAARERLRALHQLLRGFQALGGGWATDRELAVDITMVADYLELIETTIDRGEAISGLFADSLRLAGGRKIVITPPVASADEWTNPGSDR